MARRHTVGHRRRPSECLLRGGVSDARALLSNAVRLLTAALTILRDDNIALSRSLVILALKESG